MKRTHAVTIHTLIYCQRARLHLYIRHILLQASARDYYHFQHCEQIRVYQTCRIECALNVLSWDVAFLIYMTVWLNRTLTQ